MGKHLTLASAALIAMLILAAGSPQVRAEVFVAGYVGATRTEKNDVEFRDGIAGTDVRLEEVRFQGSFTGGGKVGYWSEAAPNVGIELDASYFQPDVPSQTVIGHGGQPSFSPSTVGIGERPAAFAFGPVDRADIGVIALGLHALGRVRFMKSSEVRGGHLQPYLGVGPALFFTRARFTPFSERTSNDVRLGLQALAGVAVRLNRHFALFAEYKFNHFNFKAKFESSLTATGQPSTIFQTNMNTHQFCVGAGVFFSGL